MANGNFRQARLIVGDEKLIRSPSQRRGAENGSPFSALRYLRILDCAETHDFLCGSYIVILKRARLTFNPRRLSNLLFLVEEFPRTLSPLR
jgi:hypothetical protein